MLMMIKITMLMITFINSTISKPTSPANYSWTDRDKVIRLNVRVWVRQLVVMDRVRVRS